MAMRCCADYRPFAVAVRTAVANAFVKLGEDFAKEFASDASGGLRTSNDIAASEQWFLCQSNAPVQPV